MYKIYTRKPGMPQGYIHRIWLIMRLTTIILIATFMQVYSAGLAQKISMSQSKAPLKAVLKELRSQSGYNFVYTDDLLKMSRPVDIKVKGADFEDVLKQIFSKQPLTYSINKNTITVKAKDNTSSEVSEETLNDIVVQGRITDSKGETLPGVSIKVKGTSMGTSSDMEGRYSINVPDNAVLVFTYIGYVTKEIVVNNQSQLNVTMEVATSELNEVVVTALGIKREAKSLTYSTQSVSTSQLTESRELNVVNSLQGKVSGLSINSSGTGVGAEARVILRGNRSISGDSQPLYVVDGVPIRGNPTNISSDNIASINILKGPNAAALYGSAAQNGAIIIETKRGTEGGVNISLNNTFMMMDPIHSIEYQNVYGQGLGGIYRKDSEAAWGPKMEGQMVDHWSTSPALAGTQYPFSPQPDNKTDIFQTGYNFATNLLATVGGEKTQSVFSYTLTDAKGILPNNNLQRHNISVRVISKLSDKLTLDSKVDYMKQGIDNRLAEGESNYNPMRQIYRTPPNITTQDAANFEFLDALGNNRQHYWNPSTTNGANPYWTLNRNINQVNRDQVIALASLSYDFSKALKFMVRGSYDGGNSSSEEKLYNDTYTRAPDGRYSVSDANEFQWNADALISYTKDVAKDWNVSANLGGNIRSLRNSSVSGNTGVSMIVPNFFSISNTNLPVAGYDPGSNLDIHSVYAFGQIAWKNAIFLDATGRNDWSSTLPANNRSYFYPSFGLSAVLSDLFPTFPKLFTFAKVRASWAQVGNSAPPYMLQRTASFRAGGNNGFLTFSSTLPNPNLLPEQTVSREVGIDLRFFNGRLGLDATAYKTNTRNQLFTIALPVGSGASQFFTNGGDVENKGLEFLLSSTPLKSENFDWDLNLNFSVNRSMVNKISDERPRVVVGSDPYVREFVVEQGHRFGEIYSRGWQRDNQGRVLVGANGMPLITSGRTVLVANFNPDWQGSISNSISYKNLSASFLIDHRQGGSVVSMTNAILNGDGLTEATLQGREGGVIFGDDLFSGETAVKADGSPNTTPVSSEAFWRAVGGRNTPVGEAFIADATNTRLRELTLGYTFPKSLFTKLRVSDVKLSLVARNLFFIYRADNSVDPDFLQGTTPDAEGFQSFAPPTTRSFGLNLKIDF